VGVKQKPRKFVDDNDAGMQMICWPNEWDRPTKPLFYADEVMTGFEYAAAATMVQKGLLKEGYMVVKAIYDRYDGRLRTGLTPSEVASQGYSGNPFGDDECGKFYGRALSVWSMLLASQGYYYNGPEKAIGFAPQWQPHDHASFFTAAEGWGLFQQKQDAKLQSNVIKVAWGKLDVAEIRLTVEQGRKVRSFKIEVDGKPIAGKIKQNQNDVVLKLKKPVSVAAGQKMNIQLKLK
jgi:hypothetical protein